MESNINDSFIGVIAYSIKQQSKLTDDCIKKICDQITELSGGDYVYISKQYNQKLSVRNAEIKRDYQSGITKDRLETKYLLSRFQINRILRA